MRRLLLLTLVFMLVIGAVAVAPAVAKKPGKEVPFKATLGGDVVEFLAPDAKPCPNVPGVDVVTRFEGSGRATHLGRVVEVVAMHCTDFDQSPVFYSDGVITLTAANGDELHGTYANGISSPDLENPPVFLFEDEFTFTDGGTGRFTVASGGGIETGDFNPVTMEWSLTMDGEVFYSRK